MVQCFESDAFDLDMELGRCDRVRFEGVSCVHPDVADCGPAGVALRSLGQLSAFTYPGPGLRGALCSGLYGSALGQPCGRCGYSSDETCTFLIRSADGSGPAGLDVVELCYDRNGYPHRDDHADCQTFTGALGGGSFSAFTALRLRMLLAWHPREMFGDGMISRNG